ncbi:hypothetical protein EVAR_53394_1 [Eumeta japonica]|uniref:Uncharacterized protein n=1 Tax=Eumeta variegata TaxID=151549 RepID=A0A4C1Y877_EUMVA|nr:hypothetical protein EVAR_53394_1 [Eumeta japonica]
MKRCCHCTKQASLSAVGYFPSFPSFSVGHCTRTDSYSLLFLEFSPCERGEEGGEKSIMDRPCARAQGDAVGARLPYGCLLSGHLGIGGHVKFAVRTETLRGFQEAQGAHRIDDL